MPLHTFNLSRLATFAEVSSYVDARDVGAVAAHLLTEEEYQDQEYEVTGPETLSCGQLVEIFSTLLDVPFPRDAQRGFHTEQYER